MKYKSLILILTALLLACSISAVVAESTSIGDYTFDIPDGYKAVNITDTQGSYAKDNDHAIVVIFSDSVANTEDSKKDLESDGYKYIGENTYDADGYTVTQQNYEKDGYTAYCYSFQLNDGKYCIVTYTIPSDEEPGEGPANPITGILNSIE